MDEQFLWEDKPELNITPLVDVVLLANYGYNAHYSILGEYYSSQGSKNNKKKPSNT